MRPLTTRGVTLLELLLVLVISVLLSAMVGAVVVTTARTARRQAVALNQQRNLAAVSAWWRADLRDGESGDVTVPATDRVLVHHPVGAGAPCLVSGNELRIARDEWVGQREPEVARDRLWLLTEPVTAAWNEVAVVATGSGSCPDGRPAFRVVVDLALTSVQLVRAVEPLALRLYRSTGLWWFGLAPADASSPVQPIAGPFDPAGSRFAMDNSGVHAFVQPAGSPGLELLGPLPWP